MKRWTRKLTALLLAVLMAAIPTVNAGAAANTKYVSDVLTVTAASASEAKKLLEEKGYALVSGNLNGTLSTGVYLGIRETADSDEALTDLALMNMLGGYSYSDYETIMKSQSDAIFATVENLLPAIAEYQANYDAGAERAKLAYDILNLFRDDDSGKRMGDYLQDFDFTEEAEKDLVKVFLQGNSQIILTIEKTLATAVDTEEATFVERLQELGTDGLLDEYLAAYPTTAKALRAMAEDFGDTAAVILKDWDQFHEYLQETERDLVNVDADGTIRMKENAFGADEGSLSEGTEDFNETEKDIVDSVGTLTDEVTLLSQTAAFALYAALAGTEYGDGTLLSFFMRPSGEVTSLELYTLVSVMSDGQRAQLDIIGMQNLLLNALGSEEDVSESGEQSAENIDEVIDTLEDTEPVSVYSGVDRSIFTDGVAFTDSATQHERLTGKSWIEKLTGAESEKAAWMTSVIYASVASGILCTAGVIAAVVQHCMKSAADAAASYATNVYELISKAEHDLTYTMYHVNYMLTDDIFVSSYKLQNKPKVAEEKMDDAIAAANTAGKTAKIVKCVSFALFAIAFVFDVYSIIQYFTAEEAPEEAIPHHIMTSVMTEYGEDYVYYEAVKGADGKAADLHNHETSGTGWLVLYQTKDPSAGDPILASALKIRTGDGAIDPGMSYAHLFNETAAANITAKTYTGVDDSVRGTYLLFTRGAALTGGVLTFGRLAITSGVSLAVGLALGFLLKGVAEKRKKRAQA